MRKEKKLRKEKKTEQFEILQTTDENRLDATKKRKSKHGESTKIKASAQPIKDKNKCKHIRCGSLRNSVTYRMELKDVKNEEKDNHVARSTNIPQRAELRKNHVIPNYSRYY